MYRGQLYALVVILLVIYVAGVLLLSSLNFQHRRKSRSGLTADGTEEADGGGSGVATRRSGLRWCQPLRFLPPTLTRPVTALASFPGSGNTWLRYLLQQATGVYTGSVYKDYGLLKNGFPAESVVNESVSVVKTHEWGPSGSERFTSAVLLIRAPGPAILAEFNRQNGGHIGFASPERFRRNKGRYWQQFVKDKLRTWRLTNLHWLCNFTGPIHVIMYEQLVTHLDKTLRALIHFLDLPLDEAKFRCALRRHEGIYKRRPRSLRLDPFNPSMKSSLQVEQDFVYKQVQVSLSKVRQRHRCSSQ